MQTSGSRCCTHRKTCSRPGLPLPLHWGREQLRRTARTPSPALKLLSSNTTKPGLGLFFLGTKFSPDEVPEYSHLVHTKKPWSGISAETFAHQRSISPCCVRGHDLQKSHILWSERQDETGDSGYWGFWLAGNTIFFSLFFGTNSVLTDDREEDGALSKYSSWKSMRFSLRSHQHFTAALYITH